MPNVTESSTANTEDNSAVGIKKQNKEKSRQTSGLLNKPTIMYAKHKIMCYVSAHFCLSIPRLIYLLLLQLACITFSHVLSGTKNVTRQILIAASDHVCHCEKWLCRKGKKKVPEQKSECTKSTLIFYAQNSYIKAVKVTQKN